MANVGSYPQKISMPLEKRTLQREDAKIYSRGQYKHANAGEVDIMVVCLGHKIISQ
jgi:hypothetical protein